MLDLARTAYNEFLDDARELVEELKSESEDSGQPRANQFFS